MSKKILTDLDFGAISKATNLPAPTATSDAATKAYVDSSIEGLAWKDSVRAASTANINLASPGTTIDGVTMVALDRFLAKNQTAGAENGIYVWNGAAAAATRAFDAVTGPDLKQAITTAEEGTANAATTWRQTAINITIGTTAVAWVAFGTAAAAASTSVAGVVQLATQLEVDTGTDALKVLTPATYAGTPKVKKFTATLGDGAATQYDISHNLNTLVIVTQVYRTATPFDTIECDMERPTVNTVRLRFSSAPASGAYTVVVLA